MRSSFTMAFTREGRRALAAIQARTGLSRNNIITHLVRAHSAEASHASLLHRPQLAVLYPGKSRDEIMSIRMPASEGDTLRAMQDTTGKSYSDLGELLVRRFGSSTTFPTRPAGRARR